MIICILILKKALQCFWNPVLLFPGVECGNWKLFATKIAKNTKNVKNVKSTKNVKNVDLSQIEQQNLTSGTVYLSKNSK